ncbi:hypothetical protein JWR97_22430 [Pseudomonas cedrina subsp. fulgida]|nr:hypothetical protein [Pseudomonas cedrina subsp. fulgida]
MSKNNHYIMVDVTFSSLHDLGVSRIGSVGNKRFERARLTAELFFPDVHCPQGGLMKLTVLNGSVQAAQMLLVFVMKALRSSSSARLHASGSRPCPYSADRR